MSLHYLLDGYNIIKKTPSLASKKLEEGRQGLISLIENRQPQGSMKNTVTIVFDGQPGMLGRELSGTVKVFFTSHETADERIKHVVAKAPNKKIFIVVTDDREIKYYVRALGAKVLSVKEFLEKTELPDQKKSQKATHVSEKPKNISKTLEYEITSEFQKIWLNK